MGPLRWYSNSIAAAALATSALTSCVHESHCQGTSCHLLGFDWPEGGEIRVEYVRSPDGELSRGIAFFKSTQTPATTPFPVINAPGGSLCNDLDATPMWPTAHANDTPLDVGDVSIQGGGRTIPFQKETGYIDFLGRSHGIAYAFQDTSMMISPSTLYDIVMTGAGGVPPTNWEGQLAIPATFDFMPPELPLALSIPLEQDFAIAWEMPQQLIDPAVLGLVAFLDSSGMLSQLCLTSEAGSGFTVPKSVLAKIPMNGTLVRGQTTHQLREFPNGRRFDVIGTWCYATPYAVE